LFATLSRRRRSPPLPPTPSIPRGIPRTQPRPWRDHSRVPLARQLVLSVRTVSESTRKRGNFRCTEFRVDRPPPPPPSRGSFAERIFPRTLQGASASLPPLRRSRASSPGKSDSSGRSKEEDREGARFSGKREAWLPDSRVQLGGRYRGQA